MTPVENCKQVVVAFLAQVPDALRQGYSNGVNPDQISVEYGTDSAEWSAVVTLQAELISAITTNGQPEYQLGLVDQQVPRYCAGATR